MPLQGVEEFLSTYSPCARRCKACKGFISISYWPGAPSVWVGNKLVLDEGEGHEVRAEPLGGLGGCILEVWRD
eukprot:118305-Amorphochlora_amoeboformis.AAC.1